MANSTDRHINSLSDKIYKETLCYMIRIANAKYSKCASDFLDIILEAHLKSIEECLFVITDERKECQAIIEKLIAEMREMVNADYYVNTIKNILKKENIDYE